MATFEIIEGRPGQGKSLYTARLAKKLLSRNKSWYKKSGILRPIVSNLKFTELFEKQNEGFVKYWVNVDEICEIRDADLIWDEIATELDSRNYTNLSEELKRFLSQYRKRGVDIYANTQDFSMIDVRARLMVTRVATLSKMFGSRDPSPTKPPVKRIYGMVFVRDVINFKATDQDKKKYRLIPDIFFIDREDVEIYDTRQDILSGILPEKRLRKEVAIYRDPLTNDIEYKKIRYI